MNTTLAQVLEQCRSKNMPRATIESAIKSAVGQRRNQQCSHVLEALMWWAYLLNSCVICLQSKPLSQNVIEARGPGGCLLLIDVLTDNAARSHQEIKRLLVRNGYVSISLRDNFLSLRYLLQKEGKWVIYSLTSARTHRDEHVCGAQVCFDTKVEPGFVGWGFYFHLGFFPWLQSPPPCFKWICWQKTISITSVSACKVCFWTCPQGGVVWWSAPQLWQEGDGGGFRP